MNGNYEANLKDELAKNVWLRHLFNKIGKEVEFVMDNNEHIRGVLKAIDKAGSIANLEIENSDNVFFLNWRNVVYMKLKSEEGR